MGKAIPFFTSGAGCLRLRQKGEVFRLRRAEAEALCFDHKTDRDSFF